VRILTASPGHPLFLLLLLLLLVLLVLLPPPPACPLAPIGQVLTIVETLRFQPVH